MHNNKQNYFWNDTFAELDRIFDRTVGNSRFSGFFETANTHRGFRVDVYDDNSEVYQVVAEVPGVAKEDIDIQLEKDVLTITAKRKVKQGESEQSAQYSRSVTINDEINADKITAKLEDGILTVSLPKAEARKPKSITVN
ncbi:Hsp20/alpha crystallin family protein [Cerasicoccus frondis]|uniref:Hsp20/alpha crystallin family protein n=1 Tax=Cerasicoccus frondis TaxID=490090 RepID=UPI0028525D87|nr:Hsp20/alpha crystallin family protein [Cerasicoccus frondis]